MRALVDTCVIMDAIQDREPFAAGAKQVFRAVANNWFTGCITAKSVTDIYYLSHRCTHSDEKARLILSKLFLLFDVVDTAGMDVRRALSSDFPDFEDAVMLETAVREEAGCIITRNLKDYKKSPIPVYTPDEFIRILEKSLE